MSGRSLSAVLLAAGSGTRMLSNRPKPLHLLCGRPMLVYALESLAECRLDTTAVVVGQAAERITKRISEDAPDLAVEFVEQAHPRGSADATYAALAALGEDDLGEDDVVVLAGDMPLLEPATLAALVAHHRANDVAATVLVGRMADSRGRSRVLRGRENRVVRLVPDAEVDLVEGLGDEVAALAFVFRRNVLVPALRRVLPDPVTGELMLDGVIEVLSVAGYLIGSYEVDDVGQLAEVNDRVSLAAVEAELRRRINLNWLEQGVTMVDPATTYVDATVVLARDVTLFPNTLLQGRTVVGEGCEIGPDTRLVDCMIGANARVQKTVGQDAEVGPGARVGPFATLEPGAQVPADARIASFVTVSDTGPT
ncbi:MAG: NTP transferase domain-containing protein [Acidimicrobiia bacterium]|nr:NTP transferase domain-containing protein [Acidimicrobiia bacterium]